MIDVRLARVAIFEGLVLLITRPALTILSSDELRAQVAHEIGHPYVSGDYDRASSARDRRRLKELELLCDAIAIALLRHLGIDPAPLMTGIKKVTGYNRERFGAAVDESGYPTLAERREFAREVAAWITAAPKTSVWPIPESEASQRHRTPLHFSLSQDLGPTTHSVQDFRFHSF